MALDAGLIAGSISQPSSFFYGLSAGIGTIVPMLKFEFEGYRIRETGLNSLSAAVKFRPKFGSFAPYAVLGAGGEFEKLNFHFSEYSFYTMHRRRFAPFFLLHVLPARRPALPPFFRRQPAPASAAGSFIHL